MRNVRYVVSGHQDMSSSMPILEGSGRSIRHDQQVADLAADEISDSDTVVIVSHGDIDGTVYFFKTSRNAEDKWLWVAMERPPVGARIYLYACHAGRHLPAFLQKCEVMGHVDQVPMPDDDGANVTMSFLAQVDALMAEDAITVDEMRIGLSRFVNKQIVDGDDSGTWNGGSFLAPMLWHMLRRSLGNQDN